MMDNMYGDFKTEEKPPPTRNERRRKAQESAKQWGVFIAALTALAGAGTNYINQLAENAEDDVSHAQTLAALDSSYKATRAALERMEAANKERDEKMDAMREVVAELRGALDAIGGGRRARAASDRAKAAIQMIDQIGPTPPPLKLPASLPAPTPEAVKEKLEQRKH